MNDIFLKILNMSFISSYIILIVLCIRFIIKKAPKIFSYILWGIVFIRLAIPISFKNIYSFISIKPNPIPINIALEQRPYIDSGIGIIDRTVNNILPAAKVGASINPMQILISIGAAVWLAGIVLLLIYTIYNSYKLYRKLKSSKYIKENIYEVDNLETAFVFGTVKPKIYIPSNLSEEESIYILEHEKTHIKRKDHIVKLIAFLITVAHWFNPLAWVSFYLMGRDMELSCDEKVIRKLGTEYKKDYLKTLLSLASGRKFSTYTPLAFGENDTKGRIKNILNYKKPSFWIVLIGIVLIIVLSIGFLSNPKEESNTKIELKGNTIEEYGENYLNEEVKKYEKISKVLDKKITKLEKIYTLKDDRLNGDVEVWKIEYRIKPEDIKKVQEKSMDLKVEDGWITQETNGEPYLLFKVDDAKIEFINYLMDIDYSFDTIASSEISTREYLERIKILPRETYKGNHITIEFPFNRNGDMWKAFLSQPIKQGEDGIWIVERVIDNYGSVYMQIPNTKLSIEEYYNELQKRFDNGEKELGDPKKAGFKTIKESFDINFLKEKDLRIVSDQTLDDFMEPTESHYIGYINKVDSEYYDYYLDSVEFITLADEDRIKELNIDADKMSDGYTIRNPYRGPDSISFSLEKDIEYNILDGDTVHKKVNAKEFENYLNKNNGELLFHVYTKGETIIKIEEQYLP